MKKLLFIFLFLVQVSTIKTMDPGLYAGQGSEYNSAITNPKPNNSIMDKIKNKLENAMFTLEDFRNNNESALDKYVFFPAAVFAVTSYPTYFVWNFVFRQYAWLSKNQTFSTEPNIGWHLTEKLLKFFKKPVIK